jgi:uncharacterized protein YbjQ (UPF0145 family)
MSKRTEIATLDYLDGYRIVKELGRVSVRVAQPRNRLRDVSLRVRGLFGLSVLEFLSDSERARRQSVEALLRDAQRLGADAVIGVRFRIGKTREGATHVLALGRAVLLDQPLSAEREAP